MSLDSSFIKKIKSIISEERWFNLQPVIDGLKFWIIVLSVFHINWTVTLKVFVIFVLQEAWNFWLHTAQILQTLARYFDKGIQD